MIRTNTRNIIVTNINTINNEFSENREIKRRV